jgi:peptide/nickel transport system substrate-binding protein
MLGTTACGDDTAKTGAPQRGGELSIGRNADMEGYDPSGAVSIDSTQTHGLIYESLVKPSEDGKSLVSGVAKEFEYDPQKPAYTFHLRPDLKFSNGKPLTSADAKFAIELRKNDPNLGLLFQSIRSVETPDPRTVVVSLSKKDAVLEAALAQTYVFPKDFGGKSQEEFFKAPVFSGAYTVASWKPGSQIVLKKNPNYWNAGKVYIDKVTYEVIPDVNQRLVQFQSGELDMIETIPVDSVNQLEQDQIRAVKPTARVDFLIWGNPDKPPFDDVNVRRAMSLAIDRKALIEGVMKGYATWPKGTIPPSLAYSVGSDEEWSYDLQAAKRAMAESASSDGFSVTMLYDTTRGSDTLVAQAVKEQLAKIGVDVKLDGTDFAGLVDRFTKGDYDLMSAFTYSTTPTAADPIATWAATDFLFTGFDTSKVKETYAELQAATGDAQADAAVRDYENWAHENVPFVPLMNQDAIYGVSTDVKGLKISPFQTYFLDGVSVSDG